MRLIERTLNLKPKFLRSCNTGVVDGGETLKTPALNLAEYSSDKRFLSLVYMAMGQPLRKRTGGLSQKKTVFFKI